MAGIVRLAAEHVVPLVPRGGGTGLSTLNASYHLRLVVRAQDAAESDQLRQGRRMAHALDPLGILNPGKVL